MVSKIKEIDTDIPKFNTPDKVSYEDRLKLVKDRYALSSKDFEGRGYRSKKDALEEVRYKGLIEVSKSYISSF